jgi:SAM-dependent methyltransferase
VTDAYGTTARWYDTATGSVLSSVREHLANRIAGRIAATGERRILDIGCGTGMLLAMLLQQGLDVTGVDTSLAMLAEVGKKIPQERLLHISGLPLPFENASCDVSILCLVMHESSSGPDDLLAEALRVAPRCYVVEWRMPERNLDYCPTLGGLKPPLFRRQLQHFFFFCGYRLSSA